MLSKIDAMKRRVSVRTYHPERFTEKDRTKVGGITAQPLSGPFGTTVRTKQIVLSEMEKKQARKFGTYGFIRGTTLYMVGIVSKETHATISRSNLSNVITFSSTPPLDRTVQHAI